MTQVKNIDSATLKSWIDDGAAVVIDVREESEYREAHIEGAVLIPLGVCDPYAVPCNPDKKIVFQCKAGKRADMAAQACLQAGPDRVVYNLEGGMDAWIAQGYPYKSVA